VMSFMRPGVRGCVSVFLFVCVSVCTCMYVNLRLRVICTRSKFPTTCNLYTNVTFDIHRTRYKILLFYMQIDVLQHCRVTNKQIRDSLIFI